jgi:hypothetical protein
LATEFCSRLGTENILKFGSMKLDDWLHILLQIFCSCVVLQVLKLAKLTLIHKIKDSAYNGSSR